MMRMLVLLIILIFISFMPLVKSFIEDRFCIDNKKMKPYIEKTIEEYIVNNADYIKEILDNIEQKKISAIGSCVE